MCVKNLCKQTVLVQLVIENVVTCFYWNTVYACLLSFRLRFSPLYPPLSFAARGVATGGMSVYIPPKSVTVLFTCGTLTHVLKLQ